jgi:flagellar protein FlaF
MLEESNPLPDQIKENLLNLSVFIDKRTFEIMIGHEKPKLDILIDININIAAGLRGSPGESE